MSKKILPLILTTGFALLFNACGSDGNSVSGIDCDEGDCFEESSSSVSEESNSSSSIKKESSSSAKDEKSSSSVASSSSSTKEESSSSEKAESSSSEAVESSSSVKITYLNTTPNLADLEVSGDTLFAIFQRQSDDYTIPEVGLLALYDAESGDLLDTIRLATKNPSAVKVSGGTVYVATAGEYDATTWCLPADENRGIEKIDLQKKTSTLFVSGKSLGGGVSGTSDFVINANGTKGYAAVYQSYGSVPVVEIDLATGSVKTIEGIKNASGSLEYDDVNGLLYIGEYFMEFEEPYEMNIGVFAYNGKTVATLTNENETRPPYSIKLLDNSLYVFVSDYGSGKLYMDYQNFSDGISYYQDSKLAVAGNSLYLMERSTAPNVSRIDLATGKTSSWQVLLDAASNPYDIVLASDGNLWLALYGTAELRKVSVKDGSTLKSVKTDIFCAHE